MWVIALYLFFSLVNGNLSSVNAQLISFFSSLRSLIHTNPTLTIAQTILSVPLPLHTNSHRSSRSRPPYHCPLLSFFRYSFSSHLLPPTVSSSTKMLLDRTKIDCETLHHVCTPISIHFHSSTCYVQWKPWKEEADSNPKRLLARDPQILRV